MEHGMRKVSIYIERRTNFVLNWRQSAEEEFDEYARAFHRAAKRLTRVTGRRGYNDLDLCPILNCYRMSLELYLKAVVLHGNKMRLIRGQQTHVEYGELMKHGLVRLFPYVRATFNDAVIWAKPHQLVVRTAESADVVSTDIASRNCGSCLPTSGREVPPPRFGSTFFAGETQGMIEESTLRRSSDENGFEIQFTIPNSIASFRKA
jgi:hypothetical protein